MINRGRGKDLTELDHLNALFAKQPAKFFTQKILNHTLDFNVVYPKSEFVFHANGNRPQDMYRLDTNGEFIYFLHNYSLIII